MSDKNSSKILLDKLASTIIDCEADQVQQICQEISERGIDPLEAIEKGIREALDEVGNKYEKGFLFLPELIMAAKIAESALNILTSKIKSSPKKIGKYVIGTVKGDIHDLGKNIVVMILKAFNFEVIDLGVDVPIETFIEKVKNEKPQILGLSALLMTTVPVQRDVIEALEKNGIRNKVKVMVGGVAVTDEWAKEIGADAYADNAAEAVRKAKELIGVN